METPYSAPAYRDRGAGLIVFGIVEMAIGCLCAGFVLLMVVGMMMAPTTGAQVEMRMMLPSLVMYPLLAVAFIWLGIGSMTRKRWARALSLIVAWSWLLVGAAATVMFLLMAPTIFGPAMRANGQMPEELRAFAMAVAGIVLGFLFVIMPGALVLFYRSPHVKGTCDAADPKRRWTDGCPLPVLAASLWMLAGGLMMPLVPVMYKGVFPLFGVMVSGVVGTIVFLVLTAVWLYAAWAMYRLKAVGWWVTLITLALLTISNAISFSTIDMMEMYRGMGYSEEMLEQIEAMQLSGRKIVAMALLAAALMLGYLLFIYRYFAAGRKRVEESTA